MSPVQKERTMITTEQLPLGVLYERDETAWLEAMSELIGAGDFHELDYPHLKEYLEDMARRDRRKVESRLAILIAHLLKWTCQPEMRTPSWRGTIIVQRYKLTKLLESGSIRQHAQAVVAQSFADGLKLAIEQTRLSADRFPPECPWTLDELLTMELADQ